MNKRIAIIGGGPSGLMAAETLSAKGVAVTVFEAMPTVGRKLLMAGKSGLNLTHAELMDTFVTRFGAAQSRLEPALRDFDNNAVRSWAESLGTQVFVGSSGRVFPQAMKASPLLRAWLKRLEAQQVTILTRHRWIGFEGDALTFETPTHRFSDTFDAFILALGGASWQRLGSDAAWVPWLEAEGIEVEPFKPANCGFDVNWSAHFIERFAGGPVKSVAATSRAGTSRGEFIISRNGIEGSLVYAHSAALRGELEEGPAALTLDLSPERTMERLERDLSKQPGKASLSNRLRKGAGLDAVKSALVRELTSDIQRSNIANLAKAIKSLPVPLLRPRPLDEAISVSGGVDWGGITQNFMLKNRPGAFVAGEMLDWEAPTGGYLLSACFATGRAAAKAVHAYITQKET